MTQSRGEGSPAIGQSGLDDSALRRLAAVIEADIDRGQYSAASILVARWGDVQYRATIGEVAPGRPAATSDVYLLMSLSKAFTASLVLHAIDRGRFSLDTRVADILPGFGVGGKRRVTVRHLLTHTAGTYSGFAPPPPLSVAEENGNLARAVEVVSALPAANTPGERVVYNPFADYAVLGQILVTTDPRKRAFQHIAREDLFEPLGMHDTAYGHPVGDARRVPVFVQGEPGSQMETLNTTLDERSEHPAGGAFGTVDDVFRFADMLRQRGSNGTHRLISQSLFDYAVRNHTDRMVNGFWDFDREVNDIPVFPANFSLLGGYVRGDGHYLSPFGFTASPQTFGGVGGGSTMWMVDPQRELTFVFLSAGFIEGLNHFVRLQRLSDLVLAAVVD